MVCILKNYFSINLRCFYIYLRKLEEVCSLLLPCGFRNQTRFFSLIDMLNHPAALWLCKFLYNVLSVSTWFVDLLHRLGILRSQEYFLWEKRAQGGKNFKKQTKQKTNETELRMRLGADRLLDPYPWTDCKPSELASCAAWSNAITRPQFLYQ